MSGTSGTGSSKIAVIAFAFILLAFVGTRTALGLSLPIPDCTSNCGNVDSETALANCESKEACDVSEVGPKWDTCELSLSNRQTTLGSVTVYSCTSRNLDRCDVPTGTGTLEYSHEYGLTEIGTRSWDFTFGVAAKASVNMWIIGETAISADAAFSTGGSNSTSKDDKETDAISEPVGACSDTWVFNTTFQRLPTATGTATVGGTYSCREDCPDPCTVCDAGPYDIEWVSGACTSAVALGSTREYFHHKAKACAICCTSVHEECCSETCTAQERSDDISACEASARTYP